MSSLHKEEFQINTSQAVILIQFATQSKSSSTFSSSNPRSTSSSMLEEEVTIQRVSWRYYLVKGCSSVLKSALNRSYQSSGLKWTRARGALSLPWQSFSIISSMQSQSKISRLMFKRSLLRTRTFRADSHLTHSIWQVVASNSLFKISKTRWKRCICKRWTFNS